ncbi:hypothetical protein L1887_55239 [Cichorium endivia]|nr:hypothetical protein L1887_55239 [Cichorium endivia]
MSCTSGDSTSCRYLRSARAPVVLRDELDELRIAADKVLHGRHEAELLVDAALEELEQQELLARLLRVSEQREHDLLHPAACRGPPCRSCRRAQTGARGTRAASGAHRRAPGTAQTCVARRGPVRGSAKGSLAATSTELRFCTAAAASRWPSRPRSFLAFINSSMPILFLTSRAILVSSSEDVRLERARLADGLDDELAQALDLDLVFKVGVRVVEQVAKVLDGGDGHVLAHGERAVLLALLAAAEEALDLDDLVHVVVVVAEARKEAAAAERAADERLEVDGDGLALDEVVAPPGVLLAHEHAADGGLDADDVRGDKVELLLLLLVLATREGGARKRLEPADGRLDLDLLEGGTHADVVLSCEHAADLRLHLCDGVVGAAQTLDGGRAASVWRAPSDMRPGA